MGYKPLYYAFSFLPLLLSSAAIGTPLDADDDGTPDATDTCPYDPNDLCHYGYVYVSGTVSGDGGPRGGNLFYMSQPGVTPSLLTARPATSARQLRYPRFSPDGTKLFFIYRPDGTSGASQIHILNFATAQTAPSVGPAAETDWDETDMLDGTARGVGDFVESRWWSVLDSTLPADPDTDPNYYPTAAAWNELGRVIYTAQETRPGIPTDTRYKMRDSSPDGAIVTTFGNPNFRHAARSGTWSRTSWNTARRFSGLDASRTAAGTLPNKWIVFAMSEGTSTKYDLYMIKLLAPTGGAADNPAGAPAKLDTDYNPLNINPLATSAEEINPALSADGTRIAFERPVLNAAGIPERQIFTCTLTYPAGRGAPTCTPPTQLTTSGTGSSFTPCWTSDGAHLIFSGTRAGSDDREIYFLRADEPEGMDNEAVDVSNDPDSMDTDPACDTVTR